MFRTVPGGKLFFGPLFHANSPPPPAPVHCRRRKPSGTVTATRTMPRWPRRRTMLLTDSNKPHWPGRSAHSDRAEVLGKPSIASHSRRRQTSTSAVLMRSLARIPDITPARNSRKRQWLRLNDDDDISWDTKNGSGVGAENEKFTLPLDFAGDLHWLGHEFEYLLVHRFSIRRNEQQIVGGAFRISNE